MNISFANLDFSQLQSSNSQTAKGEAKKQQSTKEDDYFLSGIPWLPKEKGAPLAETKHMQNILNVFPENDPRWKRRKELYESIVEIFPAFLPARYHSMDSLALHENSKNGQYWANSTAFLLSSYGFGCTFLMDLNTNLENHRDLSDDTIDKSIYKEARNSLFKGNKAEECESAAEFLLNPWVLLQVPFHPMLMLQWATGALAEGLKFQREIVDLCMFYPNKMKNVIGLLHKMHIKLAESVLWFQEMAIVKGFQADVMRTWNSELAGNLAECIDIMEFLLSDKCKIVVKALKRMAWSRTKSTKKSEQLETYKSLFDLGSIPSYFNYHGFWRNKADITSLYDSEDAATVPSHQELYQKRIRTSESVELPAAQGADILKFFMEKLHQTGKIQGTNVQAYIAKIISKNCASYMNFYKGYQTYSETSRKLKGAGIIYDITALHSDVVLAEVEAEMVDLLMASVVPGVIYINAVNCEGPEISLNQVKNTLSKVFSKTTCSFSKLLEQVKASFNPEHAEFPTYNQGAEKIAAHLQERVKRLVFNMVQKQLKSLQESSMSLIPECQCVQMVLPCFVASILDLDKDACVCEVTKRKFIDFVHELIKSYERYEYCTKFTTQAKFPITMFVRQNVADIICVMFEDLEKAIRSKFGTSSAIDAIFRMGPSSNLCEIMLKDEKNICSMDWTLEMYRLGNRMHDALSACFNFEFCLNDFEVNFIIHCIEICVDLKQEDQQLVDIYCQRVKESDADIDDFTLLNCILSKLDLYKGAMEISAMTMSGIIFFLLVKNLNTHKLDEVLIEASGPGFAIDPVESAFWHLYCGDLIKLKQGLKKTRQGDADLYLVPIKLARSNACYKSVLRHLTKDGKVPMKQPGETTFYPVQHCRWCGLVEPDAFLVCPMCADTPEYPDLNFFCSTHCQNEALEKQHQEEHVAFLMAKCGIA